jgi:hypothetical protein
MENNEKKFTEKLINYKKKIEGHDEKELGDGEPEVKYAFITFRNMDAVNLVKRAYKIGKCRRKCALCCSCCCPKRAKAI